MNRQSTSVIHSGNAASLVDVLERILDKGIVVAGDITLKIVDIELLTIQIRLLVCSVDKARDMGMNWWMTSAYAGPASGPANCIAPGLGASHRVSPSVSPSVSSSVSSSVGTSVGPDFGPAVSLSSIPVLDAAREISTLTERIRVLEDMLKPLVDTTQATQ